MLQRRGTGSHRLRLWHRKVARHARLSAPNSKSRVISTVILNRPIRCHEALALVVARPVRLVTLRQTFVRRSYGGD